MNFQAMFSNRCLNSWLLRDFPAVPTVSGMHLTAFTSHIRDILSSNVFSAVTTRHKPWAQLKRLWPMIWSSSQGWALQPRSTLLPAHTALLKICSSQTEAEREATGEEMKCTLYLTLTLSRWWISFRENNSLFCLPTAKLACSMYCTESSFQYFFIGRTYTKLFIPNTTLVNWYEHTDWYRQHRP